MSWSTCSSYCLLVKRCIFPAKLNSLCERSCWGRDRAIDACWVNVGHTVVWQPRVGCRGRKRACAILQGSNSLEVNNVNTKVVKTDRNWERSGKVPLWTELRANCRKNSKAALTSWKKHFIFMVSIFGYEMSHTVSCVQLPTLICRLWNLWEIEVITAASWSLTKLILEL